MTRFKLLPLLLASGLLLLGGCMFRGAEELFAIPRTSETYQKLQETVQSSIGTNKAISPISGSNTQALQLVDLDRDGSQEAIAFYNDTSQEWPLKIAIFRQDERGEYAKNAEIKGAGTGIDSIEYRNLLGGAELEVLVSWQVTPALRSLTAYSLKDGELTEIMRSGYSRYLAADLNGDEAAELLLLQLDGNSTGTPRAEIFMGSGGAMEFMSTAPLSEGILSVQAMDFAKLSDGTSAVYLTSEHQENKSVTDILALSPTGLRNLTLDEQSRQSTKTLRQHTGVLPADINADGIWEVPLTRGIPSYQKSSNPEQFWQVDWLQFDAAGTQKRVLSTYHNNGDRWYLELPEAWEGQVTLSWEEDSAAGERAVVFSHWTGDQNSPPEAFLSIYRLTGNNRDNHASREGRFTLWADTETVYAAKFHAGSWNCGLDKDSLRARFHTI